MRALFTTQPGFGHLNPFLPYAVALREAGHEVVFASAPAFAEAIERHGFPCVGLGEDFTWDDPSDRFPAINEAARAGRAMEFATFDVRWKAWNPEAARDSREHGSEHDWGVQHAEPGPNSRPGPLAD
jgi:UDP:flavonoid glycosyltransferase YjiC (YdhE family)